MSLVTRHVPLFGSVFVSSRRVARVLSSAIIGGAALLLVLAAAAHAGRYHDYSCRTPSGESAPVDGWSGSVPSNGSWDNYAQNTCATGGALIAALGEQTTHFGQRRSGNLDAGNTNPRDADCCHDLACESRALDFGGKSRLPGVDVRSN